MSENKIIFLTVEGNELLFDGSNFSDVTSDDLRKHYISSAILPSNLRTHGIKVAANSTAEKIQMQAEISIFEDGGLDPEVDYSISSLTIPIDEDESFVETYAIETSKLDERFSKLVERHKHIDLIYPSAISYSALYACSKLEPKSDLFIHIDEHQAYAVMFKDGQYISVRIVSTLEEIASKINRDIPTTIELLKTKGVVDENYSEDEFLVMSDIQDQLSIMVERIAHSISHKRGVFKLDTIDRIYLDFEGSNIPGFLELFDRYGYEEATKETLDIFEDVEVGLKHTAIEAFYALCAYEEKLVTTNLTKYPRKPSFLKTNVGQFSLVMASAIILSLLYPIYGSIQLSTLQAKEDELNSKLSKIDQTTQKLQVELKKQRDKRDALRLEKQQVNDKINSYDKVLTTLKGLNKDKLTRQKVLNDINKAMKKYKLASRKLLREKDNSYTIQIISKPSKRDDIAMFIKELLALGYSNVYTKKIEKNNFYYESFVEIKP